MNITEAGTQQQLRYLNLSDSVESGINRLNLTNCQQSAFSVKRGLKSIIKKEVHLTVFSLLDYHILVVIADHYCSSSNFLM